MDHKTENVVHVVDVVDVVDVVVKAILCYKNNINNKHNFRRLYDCFCLSKSISMHPYFQLMPD